MYEATFAFMDIVISEHGHDHKMVELRSVDDNLADIAVSAPVGSATNPLPTATKVSLYPIPIYSLLLFDVFQIVFKGDGRATGRLVQEV